MSESNTYYSLVSPKYETYTACKSLVVYVSVSKKTLLLPILAKKLLNVFDKAYPDSVSLQSLDDDFQSNSEDGSVKNIVSIMERAELIKIAS